jgi:hypothetical protein
MDEEKTNGADKSRKMRKKPIKTKLKIIFSVVGKMNFGRKRKGNCRKCKFHYYFSPK